MGSNIPPPKLSGWFFNRGGYRPVKEILKGIVRYADNSSHSSEPCGGGHEKVQAYCLFTGHTSPA